MLKYFLLSLVLLSIVIACLVFLNTVPRHHPGFFDLSNPFAEPWSPDPRTQYGWPVEWRRDFDEPSPSNEEGRFDGVGMVFDCIVWLGLVSLAMTPLATAGLIRLIRRNRRKP